jgi:hypothetical protein
VKNSNKPDPVRRRPIKVGRKRSLYIIRENGVETDKVEDFLDKNVEKDFAILSKRIKNESSEFKEMSRDEVGVIARFVASQAVRTLGNKDTIEEQAGEKVDTNTFAWVMSRKMLMMLNSWINNPPTFRFHTPLPNIGDRFITGDHPIVVQTVHDNKIWTPTENPELRITDLAEILQRPSYSFTVPLSPYVAVSIQRNGGQVHLAPRELALTDVRRLNQLIRKQCRVFTLARDRDSLI